MQKIIPHLWFSHQAEEAVNFYTSIFKGSKISKKTYYGKAGAEVSGQPEGTVMTVEFELEGQTFVAINGGPIFSFTEAVSFAVSCKTQEELDTLYEKLSKDGQIQPCGWLKDQYGLSWQIVPIVLNEMLSDPDPVKSEAVMRAMLNMKKLDIKTLQNAYQQASPEKV